MEHMTNDAMYRILSEKIDINHEYVSDLLGGIKEQTTKTNARVTHLEERVWDMSKDANGHFLLCPNTKKILDIETGVKKLNEDNLEVNIIKKYPKISIGLLVGAVIIGCWMVYGAYVKFDSAMENIKHNQTTIIDEIKK